VKSRSIGNADRMHANRRLIGSGATKISGTNYTILNYTILREKMHHG
jgi:hypothetical protein